MIEALKNYLNTSYTAYHAVENAAKALSDNGFERIYESEIWRISEGGKYYVTRAGASLIAFTVGRDPFSELKIVASHADSPALKIKENPLMKDSTFIRLNVEKYGGAILYSFLDRPLKIAGRLITKKDGKLTAKTAVSDYSVIIPSLAIHMNRGVNDGFAINPQVDLCPLMGLVGSGDVDLYQTLTDDEVADADLYLVNADTCTDIGVSRELISAPRVDDLTSVFASVKAICSAFVTSGINVCAIYNSEEIGNATATGAEGDFTEAVLNRIRASLGKTEDEYYAALARSFLLSVDVAHSVHPNHPEKSDPTNRPVLGGGVVIKYNAGGSYVTDGLSSAFIRSVFDGADVPYQTFHSRSDMPCGSTLGRSFLTRTGMKGCDIGIPQLAMHSACETFAKSDVTALYNGITAFYSTDVSSLSDING